MNRSWTIHVCGENMKALILILVFIGFGQVNATVMGDVEVMVGGNPVISKTLTHDMEELHQIFDETEVVRDKQFKKLSDLVSIIKCENYQQEMVEVFRELNYTLEQMDNIPSEREEMMSGTDSRNQKFKKG